MKIESSVLTLPSIQTFLDDIVTKLAEDSVIVLIPETVSRDMVARLINNRLEVRQLSVRNVPYSSDGGPVLSVSKTLDIDWPTPSTPRSIRNLQAHLESAQIIHIRDFNTNDALDPLQRKQWTDFVVDWVRERNRAETNGHRVVGRLCLVAKLKDFDFVPPAEELGLSIFWWYGFPSTLEMRLACRIANQGDIAEEHRRRWREQVLPALVSGDVSLAEYLWDDIFASPKDITNRLVDYGLEEGISNCGDWSEYATSLTTLDCDASTGKQSPSRDLWELWANGGLVSTPEYGSELHPALLAYIGNLTEVEHRLWRGQAEFLLPILNEIRIGVCDDMTARFGPEWPTCPSPPRTSYELEAVKDNPRGTEFGHIEHLLLEVSVFEEKRDLLPMVSKGRTLRNEIAHYRPIAFADFDDLWKISIELRRNSALRP